VTYVSVTVAIVSFFGVEAVAEYEDDTALFGAVADEVLGTELSWMVVLAIITSAIASTQTTILPALRTSLSMSSQGAFPEPLGRVHPRYLTPHVSTILIGVIAAVWYGVHNSTSQNFLFDSLTSLSLMIAFYYAFTGVACAVYYRHELTKSVKNFLFIGVGPVIGSLILGYLFYKAIVEYAKVDDSYSGSQAFGIAIPVVLGLGLLLLGVVLMILWRFGGHRDFFGRRPETVAPDVAAGHKVGVAAVPEEAV
jgi:amino acid transporter